MKRLYLFIFLIIPLFISCPTFDPFNFYEVEMKFEFSKDEIKNGEPVELTVRWAYNNMEDYIIAMELLDNVEINVLEGSIFEWDTKEAIFLEFVKPEISSESNHELFDKNNPYCKLLITFKKSGTYIMRFKRTDKINPWSNFDGGCEFTKINVVE